MREHDKALERLAAVLGTVRGVNAQMPAQTLQVLLLVAHKPGIRALELSNGTGIHQSSVSRNVNALGDVHRNGTPGMGLIEQVEDPRDSRAKLVFLSPKGRELVRQVLAIETGEPADDFMPPTGSEARLSNDL